MNGGADQRLWKVLPSTTLSLKILIKESSRRSSSQWFPTVAFIAFCPHHQLLLLTVLTMIGSPMGFSFDSALCTLPTACKPLGSEECTMALSAQFTTNCWMQSFQGYFIEPLVFQVELGHFSESSLVHSHYSSLSHNMTFKGEDFLLYM